ncbi:hypothetical protein, partial [Kocuria massiliensis]|uniref:hypothetical protein n=1 Tax=Kocuria massiliensis TaxID=1926282 RepID=UPI0022B972BA
MRFFEDLVIHASFCCYVGMNLLLINLCFVAGTCVNVARLVRLVRLTRANRKYAIPLLFGRPIVQPNGGGGGGGNILGKIGKYFFARYNGGEEGA